VIPDTQQSQDDAIDRDAVFIEQYRKTGDAVTACVRAGIRDPRYPITVIAERTLARPEIQSALKSMEKLDNPLVPLQVTRESIIADFEEIFQRALSDGQYASATGAKRMQAHILGLMEQKINVTSSVNVTHMSTDALMRYLDNNPPDGMKDRALSGPVIDVEDE